MTDRLKLWLIEHLGITEWQIKAVSARIASSVLTGIGIGFGVAIAFGAQGMLQSLQERFTFPMIAAEIEVVRQSAQTVECPPSVADTATMAAFIAWNIRIAHEQESNRHWYSDALSTDRWMKVEPIRLKCEG